MGCRRGRRSRPRCPAGGLAPKDGSGRPRALIAHTVKGRGVSFMEDDNNWHYRVPNADEVRKAREELGLT